MSLTWDLTQIKDHDTVCFVETVDGQRQLAPLTHSLIFATIGTALGQITEKNAGEFYARVKLLERVDGPYLHGPDGPYLITPEDIRAHIGLVCNVVDETRTKWLGRLKRDMDFRVHEFDAAARKAVVA